MTREIKFRAWDPLYGTMMFSKKLSEFFHAIEQRPAGQEPPVMQFTGLLDRNGREVYEGDILEGNGVVKFVTSGFWCVLGADRLYMPGEGNREVIGNVWEHPDLIKSV